jgi:hypothetical protein
VSGRGSTKARPPTSLRSVSEYAQAFSAASVFTGDTAADTSVTNETLVAAVASPWTAGHHLLH